MNTILIRNVLASSIVLLIGLSSQSFAKKNDDFPLREKYKVPIITTETLNKTYDQVFIIDVRSKFEFDVIHMNNAVNIPISKKTFGKKLKAIRSKSKKHIVFYCNGHTCSKSYKATKKAISLAVPNVYAYDAGIFDWSTAHPEKATLLGETPVPTNKIIPKSELKVKFLPFTDFKQKAKGPNTMVIDVREPFQRKNIPPLANLRNITLDRLTKLIAQKKFKDKQLLLFDQVGKQVRWLQYHLKKNNYTNYYFLKGGAAKAL